MFDWLESTSVALWVKESWGWPLALTLHAFGSTIIVGFSFIMFLRLFGMLDTIPVASLKDLLPFIWVCVVLQALSGTLLWLTKPARYLEAGIFELKLALVVTGIFVTLYLPESVERDRSVRCNDIRARYPLRRRNRFGLVRGSDCGAFDRVSRPLCHNDREVRDADSAQKQRIPGDWYQCYD